MKLIRDGCSRVWFDLKQYFRRPDGVAFNFFFPIVMFILFSSIFTNDIKVANLGTINSSDYWLTAMVSLGIFLCGFQNLSISVATERNDGSLKRLGGVPLSPFSYFFGKIGQVFIVGIFQTALLILIAVFAFGVHLPDSGEHWLRFLWVFILGILASATLGIAYSGLAKSTASAIASVIPIPIVLGFISGVYYPFAQLPEWIRDIANFFPLKWLAQGNRSAFLPEFASKIELNEVWNLGQVALVLLAWLVIGLLFCRLTFRWSLEKK